MKENISTDLKLESLANRNRRIGWTAIFLSAGTICTNPLVGIPLSVPAFFVTRTNHSLIQRRIDEERIAKYLSDRK